MFLFLVRCPRCKNKMKYQSRGIVLTGKTKTCVYCGKNFKVSENVIKKI